MSLYAEGINMLKELEDEEVDQYLEEHPKIVSLFEVDIADTVPPYVTSREEEVVELDNEVIRELRQVREELEREFSMS